MSDHIVSADDPAATQLAVEALLAGQAIVVPTDTVYGLAARASDAEAVARLFTLKGRRTDVPIAVLCADADQALALVAPGAARSVTSVVERWWPGPLTVVLPRRAGLGLQLGEPDTTIGLRVPDHALVRAVARAVGPIATTSANRHGEATPPTAQAAADALGVGASLVLDGGPLAGRSSTVLDASSEPWTVLREGPIPTSALLHDR